MLRIRLWRLFAAALLAFPGAHVVAQPVEPVLLVYRADARAPEEIFQSGFTGRGQRMDLLAHTLGGACDEADPARASLWVSTSHEHEEAIGFGREHLEALPSGPQNRMWIYAIRPDASYIIVPSVLRRVAEEGRSSRSGYTPQQAAVIEHLLYNTLIATEAEVVTHYVAPTHIAFATPIHFDADDEMQFGQVHINPHYQDANTRASHSVADLQAFVPAASIRIDLVEDDGSSSGSDSDQCAMSCDRATSASSFAIAQQPLRATAPAPVCQAPKRFTPMLRDLILGL